MHVAPLGLVGSGGFAHPAAAEGLLKMVQPPRLAFGARAAQCQPSVSAMSLEIIMGGGFPEQMKCPPHRRLHLQ